MRRRDFLKNSMMGTGLVGMSSLIPFINISCGKSKRPNILWLISEDTSPDLACYGNPIVKTPNFDRLASQGIRFTNAFASSPVCSPSRSAFNSGMYQTSIGVHQHRTWKKKPLLEPFKVVADYFREAGYYTTNCAGVNRDRSGKTDWNFTLDHETFDGTDWRARKPGQPFFAQVNLRLTHRKFVHDKKNPVNPDDVRVPPYYPDHPLTRRDWADYLESIQVLDGHVSRILKWLEKEEIEDDTIVFYFGDHGRPHLWAKQWLYEGGIRVPLIVRWPGHIKQGVANDDLISLIDIAPTSLALAGIKIPGHMQGRRFLSTDKKGRNYIFAARDRCDETVDRIRCVRSKRFKYIRNFMPDLPYSQYNAYKTNQYPVLPLIQVMHERGELNEAQSRFMSSKKPEEELYDLLSDPYELHNLAEDQNYQNILKEFRLRLENWIAETGDLGKNPEPPEEIEYWKKRMAERNEQWMRNKGLSVDVSPEKHLAYWIKSMLR